MAATALWQTAMRAVVVVSGLGLAACAANTPVLQSIDRFSGEQKIVMKYQDVRLTRERGGALSGRSLAISAIGTSAAPDSVLLVLYLAAGDLDLRMGDRLDFLIDSQPLPLGEVSRQLDFERAALGALNHIYAKRIGLSTFERIARGSAVEGRLGRYEFRLSPETLARMREFAALVPRSAATASSTAGGEVNLQPLPDPSGLWHLQNLYVRNAYRALASDSTFRWFTASGCNADADARAPVSKTCTIEETIAEGTWTVKRDVNGQPGVFVCWHFTPTDRQDECNELQVASRDGQAVVGFAAQGLGWSWWRRVGGR